MTLKYETGQMFYIGSEEPPTDDFVLYDKIIGREEYTEPEKGGENPQTVSSREVRQKRR